MPDLRPLAEEAGLRVLTHDATDDWYRRCSVFADFLIEHAGKGAAEAAVPIRELRSALNDMRARMEMMTRRCLMIAEKPA